MDAVLHLPPGQRARWKKILTRKTPIKGTKRGDTIDSVSFSFLDLFSVDVKLCNGRPPYIDVVQFNSKGVEEHAEVWDSLPVKYRTDKKHSLDVK